MKRAVKYCGGCNPRYDRVALAHRIEEKIGATLLPAQPGTTYDELYVICGCSARCADIERFQAAEIVVFDSPEL